MAHNGKISDMTCTPNLADSAPIRGKKKRAHRPRTRWMAAIILGGPLILGACAEIIPKFELRDDYMFKRFLQPDRVVGEVRRDEQGNPILPEKSTSTGAN
jgi:hypothetical protein